MKTALPHKLKEKLTEAGISVHALEKQAGLKRSAVQNILHGKSKKPSAEILCAITRVLGCSIDDLIGQKLSNYPPSLETAKYLSRGISDIAENRTNFNSELYIHAAKIAAKIFKRHQLNPIHTIALNYINEIYQYSMNSKQENIDECFALWLYEKLFPKSN